MAHAQSIIAKAQARHLFMSRHCIGVSCSSEAGVCYVTTSNDVCQQNAFVPKRVKGPDAPDNMLLWQTHALCSELHIAALAVTARYELHMQLC